ncbi:hypothetical protein KEM56_006114 [Ascosphaera pollenicola]|nr:hypothetical protein KEM56_006114 [Ascosphaera pollenicola]
MSSDVKPFHISVPEDAIIDLKQRLSLTRFPDELESAEWDYGAPLEDVKRIAKYWENEFDWRKIERQLNDNLPQFTTKIKLKDDFGAINIHFVHHKSDVESSIPLLFIHGWPGSFIEVTKIISLLTKGNEGPYFDVVALSLPNFGFSEGIQKKGFSLKYYADVANKLMLRLGYTEYGRSSLILWLLAQGGDWGAMICRMLARNHSICCKAIHINMDMSTEPPRWTRNPILTLQHKLTPYTEREKRGMVGSKTFKVEGSAYSFQQMTCPQTLGYSLADSPVGLLAWIYEKLHAWTDAYPWTNEEICTWVSIYWLSAAGPAASLRIYREFFKSDRTEVFGSYIPGVKTGISYFPQEITSHPKTWMKMCAPVVFQAEHDSGGHFAAHEKPNLLAEDLRKMYGKGGGAFGVVSGKDGYL